jgi:hypothetical protein
VNGETADARYENLTPDAIDPRTLGSQLPIYIGFAEVTLSRFAHSLTRRINLDACALPAYPFRIAEKKAWGSKSAFLFAPGIYLPVESGRLGSPIFNWTTGRRMGAAQYRSELKMYLGRAGNARAEACLKE